MRYAAAFPLAIFLIIPLTNAQILTRQFGTPSVDTATSIAVTNASVYIAGNSEGTFPGEGNSGGIEPFVRKFDKSGIALWTRQFGTAFEDRAQSVAADDTGVYAAGYTDGILPGQVPLGQRDAFLRKYDANGNPLWTRQFGSAAYDYAEAVAANSTGVYVAGWTLGSLSGEVASGLGDAYIRKYDTLGNILWTRQYSAPGGQTFALKLSLDASGVYVGGTALGTFPGNDPKTYDHDAYVRKYSVNGDHLWTRQSGANGNETAVIAADGAGVYLAGTITDSLITPPLVLSFLHRYDTNGSFLWSRYIAETGHNIVTAAADATGVFLGGWNTNQAFTYKYDRNGTFLWTKPISAFPSVVASAVAVNANSLFVTGYTAGTLPGQTNSGSLDAFLLQYDTAPSPLRFVPLQPCRAVDTRIGQGFTGAYGPPFLIANQSRTIPLRFSPCPLPSHAVAFAINATVVPDEPLPYLTIWPDRDPRPLVSTLNSFHGGIVANAAIVPAGDNGAISVFAPGRTELIIDINGYFTADTSPLAHAFYTTNPCRLVDTRNPAGPLGGPSLAAGLTRTFPLIMGPCQLPTWATAYSLNATVVPTASLGFLTLWPSIGPQPVVSTLNSLDGAVVANAALVTAGISGAINAFATDKTELILDTNGYFGAPGNPGELHFRSLPPCRIADTRVDPPGAPIRAGDTRDFAFANVCGIPSTAKAYSVNVTVVPNGPLGYLTMWPSGTGRPFVSTLNSSLGRIVANAALVPAGLNGAVSIYVTNETHVVIDVNGYFQ